MNSVFYSQWILKIARDAKIKSMFIKLSTNVKHKYQKNDACGSQIVHYLAPEKD